MPRSAAEETKGEETAVHLEPISDLLTNPRPTGNWMQPARRCNCGRPSGRRESLRRLPRFRFQSNASLTNALAGFGCFFPRLQVRIVPGIVEKNKGTADLVVEILSEGPKNVIEDINVIGTKKHSREEISIFSA